MLLASNNLYCVKMQERTWKRKFRPQKERLMGDQIAYPKKVLYVRLRISDKRSFILREF